MKVTVTVNPLVAVLPASSVAVHVTGVSPTTKPDPDTGVQVTATSSSTTSTAVAVHDAGAPPGPSALTTTAAGTVNVGAVESTTVTVNPALLPHRSRRQDDPSEGVRGYSIRRPEIARAITSCWICSVPSKMSKVCWSRSVILDRCNRADRVRRVPLRPEDFGEL